MIFFQEKIVSIFYHRAILIRGFSVYLGLRVFFEEIDDFGGI
jgi:hypothetical protein